MADLGRHRAGFLAAAYILLLGLVFSYRWVPLEGSFKAAFRDRSPLVALRYYNAWTDSDTDEYRLYANLMLGNTVTAAEAAHLDESRGGVGSMADVLHLPPLNGQRWMPYRDFAVEYPPGNLPFLVLPRLLAEDRHAYATLFSWQMALIHLATLLLALQAARHLPQPSGPWSVRLLGGSLLALLALGPIVTSRLDPLACLFLIGCLTAAFSSRPLAAAVCLALATACKLFPALLAPLVALHWCRKRQAAHFCLAFILVSALLFGPAVYLGGERFWAMLRYHAERPTQVESLPSTLAIVWSMLRQSPIDVTRDFGSRNIHVPFDDVLRKLTLVLTLFSVAAVTWLYRRQLMREADTAERNALLIRATTAAILAIVLSSKVFSPQYVVWLVPLVFLVTGAGRRLIQGTTLVACLLTQAIYPFLYHALEHLQASAVLALLVRNGALVCVLIWLLAPWVVPRTVPRPSLESVVA